MKWKIVCKTEENKNKKKEEKNWRHTATLWMNERCICAACSWGGLAIWNVKIIQNVGSHANMTTFIYIYLYCPLWSKRFVANNRKLHKNQVKHIIKIASALAGPHIFGLAPFCVLANSNIHICSLISVPVFTLTSQTHTLIRSAR